MDVVRFLESAAVQPIDPVLAKRRWSVYRELNGYCAGAPLLSPPSANLKLAKAGKRGEGVTYGLSLAPANSSGDNTCRYRTEACTLGCISTAGNGRFQKVGLARILKTKWLMADPNAFVSLLRNEILIAQAKHKGLAVRLNTFSDIPWEDVAPWLLEGVVQAYDYSKWSDRKPPANYHLTFSASERTTDEQIIERVERGQNVAVVFSTSRTKPLPETYLGCRVIDGDLSDARHLDPKGVIVGLRAKGSMRKNPMGMVREV